MDNSIATEVPMEAMLDFMVAETNKKALELDVAAMVAAMKFTFVINSNWSQIIRCMN